MKKITPLFFVLFFNWVAVNAQEFSIGITADFSGSQYASTDITRKDALYAGNGMSYQIRMNYPFKSSFYLFGELNTGNQYLKKSNYQDYLNSSLIGASSVEISGNPAYKFQSVTLGIGYLKSKNNWRFNFDAGIGLFNLATPTFNTSYIYPSNTALVRTDAEHLNSISFEWNLMVKRMVYKKFYAGLRISNLFSSISVPLNNYTSTSQQYTDSKFEIYQFGILAGYAF